MILLDTNALIGLAEGARFRLEAQTAITAAIGQNDFCVSATAAWEVGLLATRTGRTSLRFGGDARRWFNTTIARLGLRLVPFDAEMALEAAYLPAGCPNDPADRWMIAAARVLGATLITSDRAILAYARQGYLASIKW